jgi:hypothetical protein
MKLLEYLVGRPGDLVTRDDIKQALWPDVVVDFRQGVSFCVMRLRAVLGDDAEAPRFIETLPRRGYRFIAAVEAVTGSGAASPSPEDASYRLVVDGDEIALADGDNVLGRSPDSRVWLDSASVSRRHACVRVRGTDVTIADLGSKNGTHVEGRRIEGPTQLRDGDRIRVGRIVLTFRASGSLLSTRTDADL